VGRPAKSPIERIGVFVAYACEQGQVLLDREVDLPQEWILQQTWRGEAGVPEQVRFATNLELARSMIERVVAHHIPVAWVTGDSVYGADDRLRTWLEEHPLPYVLAVASNHIVRTSWQQGRRSVRADQLLVQATRRRWQWLSAGAGAKGPRLYDWTWMKLERQVPRGWAAWLVARRSLSHPQQIVHVCAPHPDQLEADCAGGRTTLEGRGGHRTIRIGYVIQMSSIERLSLRSVCLFVVD
jgi:SRSO17 transposase